MPNDTSAAMAHLRESCAIATGKADPPLYRPMIDPLGPQRLKEMLTPARPRPRLEDELTGAPLQFTCWEAGGWGECPDCDAWLPVITDGRRLWVACQACETVTIIP